MPRLIISPKATDDLMRLENFIATKDQATAVHMVDTLLDSFDRLSRSPRIGASYAEFRRIVISFGASKYVAYYYFDEITNTVEILRVHHAREDLAHPEHGKG